MYAPPTRNVTSSLLKRALGLVLPAPCVACGADAGRTPAPLGLCPRCHGRLAPWPRQGCATCGRPLASPAPAGFRCGSCRRRPPPFDRLCCAYCYRPPLDAVLTALKFRRLDYLGSQLGRALARRLAAAGGGLPEVVVPVPLHWWRFLRRGYNQAALIARPLAEQFGVPMETLLRRRRATPPQSRLAREARLRNPRGAFALRRGARCAGRRVLLVDDVMTTGATLAAAAVCLRRAGAREIIAAAAARAPLAG